MIASKKSIIKIHIIGFILTVPFFSSCNSNSTDVVSDISQPNTIITENTDTEVTSTVASKVTKASETSVSDETYVSENYENDSVQNLPNIDISTFNTIEAPEIWTTELLNQVLYVGDIPVQFPLTLGDLPYDSAERITLKANDMLLKCGDRTLRTVTCFDIYPDDNMPVHCISYDGAEADMPIIVNGVTIGTSRKEAVERLGKNFTVASQITFKHDIQAVRDTDFDAQGYVYLCMPNDGNDIQEDVYTRIGLCFDENDNVSYIAVNSEEYYRAIEQQTSPDKVISEHKSFKGSFSALSEEEFSTVYIGGAPVTVPCKISDIDERFDYLVIRDRTNNDNEVELFMNGCFVGMLWSDEKKKEITEDTLFTSFYTDTWFMGFDYNGINDMTNYEDLPHDEDKASSEDKSVFVSGAYMVSIDYPDEYSGDNNNGRTNIGITWYPALVYAN
ncbi:hypothetical protein [Ruminococcus sp.]|uniref:hypothetical protein n=1 Tax=Ruminococcus sp. TaxID=41978 RepID=UPI0025D91118|nr:hypothetical protein [Ruminococcus sp.]MBR1432278.1 hypothetical protein [Ruminococcus sp.]